MATERVRLALARARETEVFEAGPGVLANVAGVFQRCFRAPFMVVADTITFEAAGRQVHALLAGAGLASCEPFVFPGVPMLHTDYEHITRLRDALAGNGAVPVAVGAGTINDIAKRAAMEAGRRYMVVATAASVDGYSSFGAAVTERGFKLTMECPAPLAIVADTRILRAAPPELTAAGYADLASKLTAGSDWIIADVLGIEPIDPVGWEMVQAPLKGWLAGPEALAAGDAQAFERLFEGLTMSGFAMQALRKSRPASGSDHLFHHVWEMEDLAKDGVSVSHGFKVAIGTLAAVALTELVFDRDLGPAQVDHAVRSYPTWAQREEDVRAAFGGTRILDRVLEESRAKFLAPEALRQRLALLAERWDTLRARVRDMLVPYGDLRAMLQAAACPVRPEEINLTRERVVRTIDLAEKIRNRYTILDLAQELGLIEEMGQRMLASPVYLR